MSKIFVIKLGGSAVSVSEDNIFNFEYLKELKKVIVDFIAEDYKFFITLGGGYTMRKYRDMAVAAGLTNENELHWIGLTVNILHGEIVRAFYSEIADEGVYIHEDYYDNKELKISKGIKVGGGGRPGHSGDVDAILAAQKLGATEVISLKNVDGIFTKDPKKYPDAEKVSDISWDEYSDIIGNVTKHEPGGNYPIDPVASIMAKEGGISFYIISSLDLENFKNVLKGDRFSGTLVH